MGARKLDIFDRIERLHIPEPNSGCWIWLGTVTRPQKPYGRMDVDGKNMSAHRVSYSLFKGTIPEGMCVMHKCDNPSCINPEHLMIGTNQDNIDDRDRKNRVSHGVRHTHAKLTAEQVQLIRASESPGPDLCREFGVSDSTIRNVKLRLTYRDVPEDPLILASGDTTNAE